MDDEKDMKAQFTADEDDTQFPEGGRQAWLTVLGASLVQFSTFGYTNAFGVYQGFGLTMSAKLGHSSTALNSDFYVREYLTNYTPSDIGWIGGVQIFLIFACGIFTGRAFDRGYYHYLMFGGSFIHSFSFFMLSLSHDSQYYQVFLCHLGGGLATGILYVPSLAIVSHYFHRHQPLAMGIVAGGAAVGAVVHPIILNSLIHGPIGFHNGVRISAGMNTVILIVANLLVRTRLLPKKTGAALPVLEFMRDPAYIFVVIGGFFVICGLFFPVFFLQLDAVSHGVDRQLAFYCISILNATSIFGRTIPTVFVPKLGVFNLIIPFTLAMGGLIYTLGAIKTSNGFIAFAAVFGFLSGGGISLTPLMLASLSKDRSEIGARIGVSFGISAIIGLFATPIAGALLTSHYLWWRPILFTGTTMVAAGLFFSVSRFLVVKRKGTQYV